MSREYENFVSGSHRDIARDFAISRDGKTRHVECRITADRIYVYFYISDVHIQTHRVDVPDRWHRRWPTERRVRAFIRRRLGLGAARITSLRA